MKKHFLMVVALLAVLMAGRPSVAAEAKSQTEARKKELAEKLDKLNKQIKESPDDPMPCYRKAQCLMDMGRYEDGYQAAKEAMPVFVTKDNDLAWMLLESIDAGKVKVDVHFEHGAEERETHRRTESSNLSHFVFGPKIKTPRSWRSSISRSAESKANR